MARIRTIKPEFWTSEQIVECSTNARLLFVGMWNFCDDTGRHVASSRRLKMEVFPGDPFTDAEIGGWVRELKAAGLIVEYVAQGVTVWQVTGWHHQKIDRPYPSRLPPPPEKFDDDSTNDRCALGEESENDRPVVYVMDLLSGEPDEHKNGKRHRVELLSGGDADYQQSMLDVSDLHNVNWVIDTWNDHCTDHPRLATVKLPIAESRRKKIKVRLGERSWVERFTEALERLPLPESPTSDWQPDLWWLVANDVNVDKVLEGKFEFRRTMGRQAEKPKVRSFLDE